MSGWLVSIELVKLSASDGFYGVLNTRSTATTPDSRRRSTSTAVGMGPGVGC
jgi:hypothetical protein